MKQKSDLAEIECPICTRKCKIRIKNGEHINKKTKTLKKQKYYQYYCESCDDENTGWTTTESDTQSLKLK